MTRSALCALLLAAACGSPSPPPVASPAATPPSAAPAGTQSVADLVAAETAAYEKAKPVFDRYCATCHTKTGMKANRKKLDHFDMTSYPFGGEHARSVGNEVRAALGLDGHKATMPTNDPGSVQGPDLALLTAWSDAWRAAGAAGAHPADPAAAD